MSFSRVKSVIYDWFRELVEFVMSAQPHPRYLCDIIGLKISAAEMLVHIALMEEDKLERQIQVVHRRIRVSAEEAYKYSRPRLSGVWQKSRRQNWTLMRELKLLLKQTREANDKLLARLDFFREMHKRMHYLIILSAPIPEFAEITEFDIVLALKKTLEFLVQEPPKITDFSRHMQLSSRVEKWELVALESLQFLSADLVKTKNTKEIQQIVKVLIDAREELCKEEQQLFFKKEKLIDTANNSEFKLYQERPWLLTKRLRTNEKHFLRLEVYQLIFSKVITELEVQKQSKTASA